MKKILFTLFTFLLIASYYKANAQQWVSMMHDPNANVHDVQKAFYTWYSKQPHAIKHLKELKERKHESKETGDDEALMQFKRWEYFYTKRTFPSGNRPDPAVMEKQFNDFKATKANDKLKNPNRISTPANWTYVGNTSVPSGGGGDGRVAHVRFNPLKTSIVYACTPSGGLWRSNNGGTKWATNTDQLIDLAVNDIAINPLDTNIMYMATGDGDAAYALYTPTTVGVLKSSNAGKTWSPSGLYYNISSTGPSISTCNELLLNPVDTNVIFSATTAGVFLSTNSGNYWTNVLPGVQAYDVQYEPNNYKVVYASTLNGQFFRSSNSGASFTRITSGLPSNGKGFARMEIGVTAANQSYVYILAADSANGGFLGLFQSTDTGKTFTRMSNSPDILGWNTNGSGTGGQGWYDLSIAVSPSSANTLFIGGVNVWESTNGGTNWTNKSSWTGNGGNYVHADIHHITFVPGSITNLFVACDGGVFTSTNTGSSWSDVSNNLEISQQYGIGPSGLTSTLWLTGWQDNGTNLLSGSNWSQTVGGDGTLCFMDQTNNNNMYASYPYGTLYYSTNGGNNWNNGGNGISEAGPWITPWVEDPNTPNTVYAGYSNVWKSTNQAADFTEISTWATSGSEMSAIIAAPSNSNWIYASQADLLYYTNNGGTSWTNITGSLPVSNAGIYSIAVSPTKPNRVWVTFSGYSANDKVYESTDAGATWTNISAGLPNLPVNCIVYQANTADGIYVGTDQGVYYHDTTINAWVDYSTGMPNTVVLDLKISKASGDLMAATFGRGTWETSTYSAPSSAPVANFSGYPTSFCVGDPVQFTDLSTNQPDQWSWTFTGGSPNSSNLQNPVIGYLSAGTFPVSLTATNAHGNNSVTQTGYITVNADPVTPVITQTPNTLNCNPSTMSSYQWYFNNVMIPGATSSTYTHTPLVLGNYSVIITNSNGCSSSGNFTVITTGINDITNYQNVTVYPNPSNGNIQIVSNLPEGDYVMAIDNIIGQSIYSQKIHISGTNTANVNISGYGAGIYLLNIKGANTQVVKKLVVY
jgi:hypothetical protein